MFSYAIASFAVLSVLAANISAAGITIRDGNGNLSASTSLNNGILTCGSVTCPSGTQKCSVWSNNKRSATTVDTTTQCLGPNDAVLTSGQTTAPNPNGSQRVNNYAQMGLQSGAISCSGCAGDTPAEIVSQLGFNSNGVGNQTGGGSVNQQQLAEQQREFEARMQAQQQELQDRLAQQAAQRAGQQADLDARMQALRDRLAHQNDNMWWNH